MGLLNLQTTMNKKGHIFYSKILLFGEYSVIFNSMGLTIPYSHFRGELEFPENDHYTDLSFARDSNLLLQKFADHLKKLLLEKNLPFGFKIYELLKDLEQGLFFDSTIPQGFGLGSSGALVAAVYDRYSDQDLKEVREFTNANLLRLKKVFSTLESFFHGTSSGLDPLNCYVKSPILIENRESIKVVDIPSNKQLAKDSIFLLNSGKPRKTGVLVDYFIDRAKTDKAFMKSIHEEFIPLTNVCIQNTLNGEFRLLFENLMKLSEYLLRFLDRMIPESLKTFWKHGLNTNDFQLKLCGSGGGGFLLGFTQDYTKTKDYFKKQNFEIIPVS